MLLFRERRDYQIMKYFKMELWEGFNSNDRYEETCRQWDENLELYRKELIKLEEYLNNGAYKTFRSISFHDGSVNKIEIINPNHENKVTEIKLYIEESSNDDLYIITYFNVQSYKSDIRSGSFASSNDIFGTWGYSELLVLDVNLFQHNILFSSGSEINIEFTDMSIIKIHD